MEGLLKAGSKITAKEGTVQCIVELQSLTIASVMVAHISNTADNQHISRLSGHRAFKSVSSL